MWKHHCKYMKKKDMSIPYSEVQSINTKKMFSTFSNSYTSGSLGPSKGDQSTAPVASQGLSEAHRGCGQPPMASLASEWPLQAKKSMQLAIFRGKPELTFYILIKYFWGLAKRLWAPENPPDQKVWKVGLVPNSRALIPANFAICRGSKY